MSRTTCPTCRQTYNWQWDEAFYKFGFDDGDALIMTEAVADVLRKAGFTVETQAWGIHNVIITRIERDGTSQILEGALLGRDDPRSYLPTDILDLLDRKFPADGEVEVQP
jgi:hypothetical protein